MIPTVSFFPVGDGDMTLIQTEKGHRVLIDINIRESADAPDDDTPDVAQQLRNRLEGWGRDSTQRLYIDTFLLSHPHKDHCTGLKKHFHLGSPADWSKNADKIFIREIWSSPMVFRRARAKRPLCLDAIAFKTEARRRVRHFRENWASDDGNRILILGQDEDEKTADLGSILVKIDQTILQVAGRPGCGLEARLLGPLPKSDDEAEEEALSENRSSTILQVKLSQGGKPDACLFLTGGDAEVGIWERLWRRHQYSPACLQYDVLLSPHHCSWHSLSHDSWSDKRNTAVVSDDARHALSQTRGAARIVASSKSIKDSDADPPCIRAKQEYQTILAEVGGEFSCVGERPSEEAPEILEIEVLREGPRLKSLAMGSPAIISSRGYHSPSTGQPLAHG